MTTLLQRNVWFIIASITLLVGCESRPVHPDTDVAAVERDIRAHLPIGSSKAKVLDYLDERKISHTWLERGDQFPGNPSIFGPDAGPPIPDGPTEEGVIRDVQKGGFIRVDIVTDFKFDETKSKLVSFSVREVLTGP
jgi:hypothetical protein